MVERELKAVVPEASRVRDALTRAGAVPGFAGLMTDRRFDRDGELLARNQVLRLRRYGAGAAIERQLVSWKGPLIADPDHGYKIRPEIEFAADTAGDQPQALIESLGYRLVQVIDRYVEYYQVAGATVRLEWYPRMDVLIEVEGPPEAIEAAAAATGIERSAFTAEPLAAFVARFEQRTGSPAVVALADLEAGEPSWSGS